MIGFSSPSVVRLLGNILLYSISGSMQLSVWPSCFTSRRSWWQFPGSLIWRSVMVSMQLCLSLSVLDLQFLGNILPVHFTKFLNNKFFWVFMWGFEGTLLVAWALLLLFSFRLILTTLKGVFLTSPVLVPSSSMMRSGLASVHWSVVSSSGWRSRWCQSVAHKGMKGVGKGDYTQSLICKASWV